MIQSGRFFGRLIAPLLKTVLPLIKNVIKPLVVKSFEDSGLLLKGVTETFQNEVKEQK